MGKVKIDGYLCERCEHKWMPRETTKEEPKVCPKCKSPYWNIPRNKSKLKKKINKETVKISGVEYVKGHDPLTIMKKMKF